MLLSLLAYFLKKMPKNAAQKTCTGFIKQGFAVSLSSLSDHIALTYC